ncbi:hypothetical protein Gorai_008315, partial [Gossypium raimondii]|nr:hypothetical protein [Gossypium raimondii]
THAQQIHGPTQANPLPSPNKTTHIVFAQLFPLVCMNLVTWTIDSSLSSIIISNYSLLLQEQALLECDNDIDTAIKRLEDLCLGAAEGRGEKTCPVEELGTTAEQGIP